MRRNVVYLCKNKLIGMDWTLPFLMEIKKLHPSVRIVVVFLNEKQRELIRKNYNLWEGLEFIDADTTVIKDRNRLKTCWRLLLLLIKLSFSRNIIIKNADILPAHNFTMKILHLISSVREVKAYAVSKALKSYPKLSVQLALMNERSGKNTKLDFFKGNYDFFLAQLDGKQFKEFFGEETPESKMVKVGFPYAMPAWRDYVDGAIRRNHIVDNKPYFLYILTCMGKRIKYFEEPEIADLMKETLLTLKKYNNRIRTVMRPHSTTDVKQVERILKETGYTNYVIDHGHPIVLSSGAEFVLGNLFSDAMFPGYYLGKPVIEYFKYDPELFSRLGNQSYGGRCCDFYIPRDIEKLDRVVGDILDKKIKVDRDPMFIEENFSQTPQRFYDIWDDLLR